MIRAPKIDIRWQIVIAKSEIKKLKFQLLKKLKFFKFLFTEDVLRNEDHWAALFVPIWSTPEITWLFASSKTKISHDFYVINFLIQTVCWTHLRRKVDVLCSLNIIIIILFIASKINSEYKLLAKGWLCATNGNDWIKMVTHSDVQVNF